MATITGNTNQDVELMFPGLRLSVTAGPVLRASKWRGGLFVTYIQSTEGDFVVEVSDGTTTAGFLLFPSEDYQSLLGSNANWTGGQPATGVGGQNVVTIIADNTRAFFKFFETEALDGGTRTGGPITYAVNDILYVSENGLLCNDSEAQLILSGIPVPISAGIVSAVPAPRNGNRLGVDVHL